MSCLTPVRLPMAPNTLSVPSAPTRRRLGEREALALPRLIVSRGGSCMFVDSADANGASSRGLDSSLSCNEDHDVARPLGAECLAFLLAHLPSRPLAAVLAVNNAHCARESLLLQPNFPSERRELDLNMSPDPAAPRWRHIEPAGPPEPASTGSLNSRSTV